MLPKTLADAGIVLKRRREGQHRAPCPRCDRGPRDDALSVKIDSRGATWLCWRCGWSGAANETGSTDTTPPLRPSVTNPADQERRKAEADRRFIVETLRASVPVTPDDPAGHYVRWRGGLLPTDTNSPVDPDVLRFHPAVRHPTGTLVPALVMPITDATDARRITGLHMIALTATGDGRAETSPRKWTRGRAGGGVIRLVHDAEVTMGLGVAEGPETGLAIMAGGWAPVWATIAAGGMEAMPALPPLALTIFADLDERGMLAANRLADRWRAAGLSATVHPSPPSPLPSTGEA